MTDRVFVIGAGFSVPAGLPNQAQLLRRCLTLDFSELVDVAGFAVGDAEAARGAVREFISNVFPGVTDVRLEDLFTAIDITIARRAYFKGYAWTELLKGREHLKKLINIVIHASQLNISEQRNDFYSKLAYWLAAERTKAGLDADPFGLIELNWDSVIEEKIARIIRDLSLEGKLDIDYCCFSSPLQDSFHVPSLRQKAKGILNIKIQKLHGSVSWLRCPNCDRMFTGLGASATPGELYITPQRCPNCAEIERIEDEYLERTERKQYDDSALRGPSHPKLEQYLITPTYAKLFDNAHIQMVWHNAYVDLAEAERLIFVGYSLPEADYHLRALLARAVRRNTAIDVVLAESDSPAGQDLFGARRRYAEFFGDGRVAFHFDGAENYFEQEFHISRYENRRRYLRNKLA